MSCINIQSDETILVVLGVAGFILLFSVAVIVVPVGVVDWYYMRRYYGNGIRSESDW